MTSAVEPESEMGVCIATDPRTAGNLGAGSRVRTLVLPAEPSCVDVLAVINWYVDCECDVATMLVIAAHLDACCECCEELTQVRWLKSAVRRCGGAPESRSWP